MNDPTQPCVGQMVLYWETDTVCSPAVVQTVHADRIVDLVVFRTATPGAPPCRRVEAVSFQQEPAWGSWTPLGAKPGGS